MHGLQTWTAIQHCGPGHLGVRSNGPNHTAAMQLTDAWFYDPADGIRSMAELQVSPWLSAAIPIDNPYCSCKLTRVRRNAAGRLPPDGRPQLVAHDGLQPDARGHHRSGPCETFETETPLRRNASIAHCWPPTAGPYPRAVALLASGLRSVDARHVSGRLLHGSLTRSAAAACRPHATPSSGRGSVAATTRTARGWSASRSMPVGAGGPARRR